MGSRSFVVDEWLFHDLGGQHGEEAQKEAWGFLRRLTAICDKVAVIDDSPWTRKARTFAKDTESDPNLRRIGKYVFRAIITNREKCMLLREDEIESLPDEHRDTLPRKDWYLVESYNSAQACLLVTTDQKLCESARSIGVTAVMRDDFLKEYLQD